MAEISPLTVRLRELLADGEWHLRNDVIDQLSGAVPPGAAWREAERRRLSERQRTGRPKGPRAHHTDRRTAIASGARQVINQTILRQIRDGFIERRRTRVGNVPRVELRRIR